MLKYIAKRLGQAVLTLFIIITIIFCLLRMMPEEGYLGANYDKMSELQRETIRRHHRDIGGQGPRLHPHGADGHRHQPGGGHPPGGADDPL